MLYLPLKTLSLNKDLYVLLGNIVKAKKGPRVLKIGVGWFHGIPEGGNSHD